VLRRPSRQLISLAIVAFWAVMMAWLFYREGTLPFLGAPHASMPPRVLRPSSTWMGVYSGETRVGFVNINTTPDTRDGHIGAAFSSTARLHLNLLATPLDLFISGAAWIPQDGGKAEFDFKVRSGEHNMRVAATVADGKLDAQVFTGGEAIPFQFPVGKELLLSGVMGTTTLNVPMLRVGEEVMIDAFDPMTFAMGKARVKCVGEETIEAAGEKVRTKIVETSTNGLSSKAWIDDNEEIVRAETPLGFTLRRISPQEALAPAGEAPPADLLRTVAVHPTGMKPFRGAKHMTARLSGVAETNYPPTDEIQTAKGSEYTITVPSEPTNAVAPNPSDDTLKERLASDAFIQSDHPRVKERAAKIVGDETNPWRRAMRVYDWVYTNIRKTVVLSVPSALETLETREGDCNEHAVLFAALARAAGIPTRVAIGLAWSDDLDGFYYHAWPEAFVGNWIPMDPTLGQPIADSTHVKLLNGNIEAWPQLLPYLGQLHMEIVAIE